MRKYERMTAPALLASFAEQAMEADDLSVSGSAARSNAAGRKIWRTCQELKRRGLLEQGLRTLLADDRPSVRVWAAACSISFAEDVAVPVLIAEAERVGGAAARAFGVLHLWRSGGLPRP